MAKPQIKYYPVGNGDMSLITLKDETTILVDCNIRDSSKGDSDDEKFDVKEDLLKSLNTREKTPFVDVFILTHGDNDHCRGFSKNFYQGNPKDYSEKNQENGEIMVDELWFSPMIAEQHKNDDEEAIQIEAERRLELHRAQHPDAELPGNRIVIVGYDGSKDFKSLDHLRKVPGDVVDIFNKKPQTEVSFFIHSPFKQQRERPKYYQYCFSTSI